MEIDLFTLRISDLITIYNLGLCLYLYLLLLFILFEHQKYLILTLIPDCTMTIVNYLPVNTYSNGYCVLKRLALNTNFEYFCSQIQKNPQIRLKKSTNGQKPHKYLTLNLYLLSFWKKSDTKIYICNECILNKCKWIKGNKKKYSFLIDYLISVSYNSDFNKTRIRKVKI